MKLKKIFLHLYLIQPIIELLLRYGDLTPRGTLSRIFAIMWMLIGMVNLAIFTGALTTAITASQVYNDPQMYGVDVSTALLTVCKPYSFHTSWG